MRQLSMDWFGCSVIVVTVVRSNTATGTIFEEKLAKPNQFPRCPDRDWEWSGWVPSAALAALPIGL
jgi:hypothetical protein